MEPTEALQKEYTEKVSPYLGTRHKEKFKVRMNLQRDQIRKVSTPR